MLFSDGSCKLLRSTRGRQARLEAKLFSWGASKVRAIKAAIAKSETTSTRMVRAGLWDCPRDAVVQALPHAFDSVGVQTSLTQPRSGMSGRHGHQNTLGSWLGPRNLPLERRRSDSQNLHLMRLVDRQ